MFLAYKYLYLYLFYYFKLKIFLIELVEDVRNGSKEAFKKIILLQTNVHNKNYKI